MSLKCGCLCCDDLLLKIKSCSKLSLSIAPFTNTGHMTRHDPEENIQQSVSSLGYNQSS